MRLIIITVLVGLLAAPALAQNGRAGQAAPQPAGAGAILLRAVQGAWASAKRDIVESADQMPEANYNFKPVDTVRTFGQVLAHVADSNYFYCARSKGEAPPVADGTLEKTATTKAAIVKALGESVAYCDAVYGALTAASAADMVTAGNNQIPRVQPLFSNASHNVEHYGNLVTYFRMKNMVPPSTKREGGS
ncbi:MAG TPA: DinB family protein [Vicinamibacterales bacterium]|nr:DinB family protein [Vicinamibacterales bacterium]